MSSSKYYYCYPSDLADTWNIDIAQELENYLEELSTLQISLDGGKSSCNFAEAALLIQGSTSLYAKKVNSLYQLVYAALSAVTNKKYEQAVYYNCTPRDAYLPFEIHLKTCNAHIKQ